MKVMFATPTYDHSFSSEYVASMMMTTIYLHEHKYKVTAQFVGGLCFIDLARNQLTEQFLKTNADALFFIDADVGWDYKAVKRFLEYPQDIVAGLVPKRTMNTAYHHNALTGPISEEGLLETLEAPTAFMRINRCVFEKLDKEYPEYADYYTLDKGKAYFQTGFVPDPSNKYAKTFLGEDIFFCRQWVKMGGKLWIDPQIEFTHRGSQDWKGNFVEYAINNGILAATKVEELPLTGT
jgi:hypothetical protein